MNIFLGWGGGGGSAKIGILDFMFYFQIENRYWILVSFNSFTKCQNIEHFNKQIWLCKYDSLSFSSIFWANDSILRRSYTTIRCILTFYNTYTYNIYMTFYGLIWITPSLYKKNKNSSLFQICVETCWWYEDNWTVMKYPPLCLLLIYYWLWWHSLHQFGDIFYNQVEEKIIIWLSLG